MKIVILTNWFSEEMGYIENCLPKALTHLGHEVHVISSTAQVYFNDPIYDVSYKTFLGDSTVKKEVKEVNGYTLYRLPFVTIRKKIIIKGLHEKLKEIKPDVVQTFDPVSLLNLQVIASKLILNFHFFTANDITESVFPLYTKERSPFYKFGFYISRTLLGKFQYFFVSRSYCETIDCEKLALKFYGLPKKKSLMLPLGTDTQTFFPVTHMEEKHSQLRKQFGFQKNDIICIYTGRFSQAKNPLCLAKAIKLLNKSGEQYKGLFIGNGEQCEEIKNTKNCVVKEFVPFQHLVNYYQMADIGVWPTQESTSMLDATACALPIVVSNKIKATERVEGNGLTYIENDFNDLRKVLLSLKDSDIRKVLGSQGVKKINEKYSWYKMAQERVNDYEFFQH